MEESDQPYFFSPADIIASTTFDRDLKKHLTSFCQDYFVHTPDTIDESIGSLSTLSSKLPICSSNVEELISSLNKFRFALKYEQQAISESDHFSSEPDKRSKTFAKWDKVVKDTLHFAIHAFNEVVVSGTKEEISAIKCELLKQIAELYELYIDTSPSLGADNLIEKGNRANAMVTFLTKAKNKLKSAEKIEIAETVLTFKKERGEKLIRGGKKTEKEVAKLDRANFQNSRLSGTDYGQGLSMIGSS